MINWVTKKANRSANRNITIARRRERNKWVKNITGLSFLRIGLQVEL